MGESALSQTKGARCDYHTVTKGLQSRERTEHAACIEAMKIDEKQSQATILKTLHMVESINQS